MTQKIILSGFGGQGILSAGLMLAESAVLAGYNATFYPWYGAEMRGGTANCHVIISDKEVASPIILFADTLIAMNKAALDKFAPIVKDGGRVIINSSIVKERVEYKNKKTIYVPVEELALEKLGTPKIANVIMLGSYIKMTGILLVDKVKKAIEEKFLKKGMKIIELNFKALELGFNSITELGMSVFNRPLSQGA